jgi:radical SAM protein with 4Fe4S-binding SPASM domain
MSELRFAGLGETWKTMLIDRRHFISSLEPAGAAELFKASVTNIEMAISSYCNRRCPYCPNKDVDRHSQRHLMADGVFFNIMKYLKSIAYAGEICLHRYNEPLADRDYALARINDVRTFLPDAAIVIYTNGDYLDAEYLRLLREAGVSCINATVHAPPEGSTFATLTARLDERLRKLGLPWRLVEDNPGLRVAELDAGAGMRFSYTAHDFFLRDGAGNVAMLDRGESLKANKQFRRTQACLVLFNELQVEWDGTLLPCCNIHADVPAHRSYRLGRITADNNPFCEWTNENFVAWRRTLLSNELKSAPCTTCDYALLDDTPETRAWVDQNRRRFISKGDREDIPERVVTEL